MIFETKKGKYTEEENEKIIQMMNEGLKAGKREREILKEISDELKRGYAGIMSHVRKLRSEYPERFYVTDDAQDASTRLNSWNEKEEELVIQTVNQFLEEGKSLSQAISKLGKELSRTEGAIYQRIYTLRRKHPEKFTHLPAQRPRRRRKIQDWQIHHQTIRPLDEAYIRSHSHKSLSDVINKTAENQLATAMDEFQRFSPVPTFNQREPLTQEEQLLLSAFEKRFGSPQEPARGKLITLMRSFGCPRVSFVLFTLSEDQSFPTQIVHFLEQRLKQQHYL